MLLAITLHEVAHAWVAWRCGDTTAKMLGRLSVNPFRHIDPVGTLILPIALAILSQFQFIFGWAKPVPVNWSQLRHPRRDMVFVALAGPMANLIMALLWTMLLKATMLWGPKTSMIALFILLTAQAGLFINITLAVLNFIPIPPLDGSRLISGLLPPKQAMLYQKIEPFGFLILFALLFTGVLNLLIIPPISGLVYLFVNLFHI